MAEPAESAWSPSERRMLEETIVPSPNSVELERTVQSDFLHRLGGPAPHVAELYHENSKLSPHSTLTVSADGRRRLEEVRRWYFATAYNIPDEEVNPREEHRFRLTLRDLPAAPRTLLAPFARPGWEADLLYGVDLLALVDGRLLRLVAQTPYLWVERSFDAGERAKLEAALCGVPAATAAGFASLVLLVGCPWRYMLLDGPRGYRHTLMDAGRLLGRLESLGREHDVALTVVQNFYDARVDRLVYADGVERSTLAVVGLEGGPR